MSDGGLRVGILLFGVGCCKGMGGRSLEEESGGLRGADLTEEFLEAEPMEEVSSIMLNWSRGMEWVFSLKRATFFLLADTAGGFSQGGNFVKEASGSESEESIGS